MSEIVVGYDGSDVSKHAVTWAAREAALHTCELVIAHAIAQWLYDMPDDGPNAQVGRWGRAEAERLVVEAAELARQESPDVPVSTRIVPGDARPALLKAAEQAAMLVVGGRGEGGFVGLLLGSIAHGVAGRAEGPVVVVQGPVSDPVGEIIVGVDGSDESKPAFTAALAEAEVRGATLHAVNCWQPFLWSAVEAMPYGTASAGMIGADTLVDQESAEKLLAATVRDLGAEHPDVTVVPEVIDAHPVRGLTNRAEGADLLIVGRSGSGGLTEVLLGSVSRGVLHHAPCPVMIVPA